ncbi:hypothetical protein RIF29_16586 [Crotalaria pallida]|uniref:NAC domain-containing protein n=1 Tax=Crotalaria pallida TaxID=3830 RepID=A0AAN9IEL4_CROPI
MGSRFPILDYMPVGFRFSPTEEELVNHYLKLKLLHGDASPDTIIPVLDLRKHEPKDIPAIKSDDHEWYFFTPLVYKYPNSQRCDRSTKHGYWKVTGKGRDIKINGTNDVIGTMRTLVFHERHLPRGRDVKTDFVIHEYHHATIADVSKRNMVLCRLKNEPKKVAEEEEADVPIRDEPESSIHVDHDYANAVGLTLQEEMNVESIISQAEGYDFPITQQSPMAIEQGALFANSPCLNAYGRNESNMPFEIPHFANDVIKEYSEEETDANEFVNSILVDEDIASTSECHVYKMVKDSFVSALGGPKRASRQKLPEGGFCVCGMQTPLQTCTKSSHGAVYGGTHPLSPNDFWGVESSSCDSNVDKPLEINCSEISSSPYILRRLENQYDPRTDDFVSQRVAARRSQTQRKQKIWNSTCPEHMLENFNGSMDDTTTEHEQEDIGFKVKNAMLSPREVERGMWPEDYSLSDHARLTAVFSPARMRCCVSQL